MPPWWEVAMILSLSVVVGVLSRLSPKNDWNFINDWPGFVVTGIAFLASSFAFHDQQYAVTMDAIETGTSVTEAQGKAALDWWKEWLVSLVVGGFVGLLLSVVGIATGNVLTRGVQRVLR